MKLNSKRVEKMYNYTRNEWARRKTTLETSGEDVKLHSKRVEKIAWADVLPVLIDMVRNLVLSVSSTFANSVTNLKLHSKRVEKMEDYTPKWWRRWKIHSKRVEKITDN